MLRKQDALGQCITLFHQKYNNSTQLAGPLDMIFLLSKENN